MTTHNVHSSYVKHVLGGIYVFFTLFGFGVHRASPKRLVHNLLMQSFIQTMKHYLGGISVFITLFGCWVRGVSPTGEGHNLLMHRSFRNLFF